MIKIVKIFPITFLTLAVIPLSVQGFFFDEFFGEFDELFFGESNGSQIINKVNVSTNTGGNTAQDGEVIEGEGKTEIEIHNTVNGKEIDPVDIETEGNEVKVESEIKVEDDKAYVEREIEIDSEKTTESYEVDLGELNVINETEETNDTNDVENTLSENKEILPSVVVVFKDWWSGFIGGVKSFFQNIINIF